MSKKGFYPDPVTMDASWYPSLHGPITTESTFYDSDTEQTVHSSRPVDAEYVPIMVGDDLPPLDGAESIIAPFELTSVEEAEKLWPRLEETGLAIGCPATLWQAGFKSGRIDFVCVRWTGPPLMRNFMCEVANLHTSCQKPIWVTGFVATGYEPCDIESFLKEALAWMDSCEYIHRYCWSDPTVMTPELRALYMAA
jgi:hypothetical protein